MVLRERALDTHPSYLLFSVHNPPDISYIPEHKRHKQRYIEHCAQREFAAAAVGYCQRALQAGI